MFDTANIDNIYDTAIQNEKIFLEKKRVCQNTLFITEDRYIAELSYEVAI